MSKAFTALLLLLQISAVYGQGVLPSWMRRERQAEPPTETRVETRTEYKTVEIKQAPPEIIGLSTKTSENSPNRTVISGTLRTEGAIHQLLVNGEVTPLDGLKFAVEAALKPGVNTFTVEAIDTRGLRTSLSVTATAPARDSPAAFGRLEPEKLETPARYQNAVALIVGVENYPDSPDSPFSANDAAVFQRYASTALGVDPKRVKVLVNQEATRLGILRAVDFWMRSEVDAETRVYFYYSGHGLSSPNGETGYLVPVDGDPAYLTESGISLENLFTRIDVLKPKEIIAFLDSCYSGQTKSGGTLLAGARPISMKPTSKLVVPNATIFSASSGVELANSDPSKAHGLFSFYLMKGLEGAADTNKDGIISAQELLSYTRQATLKDSVKMKRPQTPELSGRNVTIVRK